jgi:hypothetical protein
MTYIFFAVVAVNTAFFASKIKQIPEDKRKDSKMIYYFSHFFLLSLVVITINQFLKRQIIIDFMPEITALAIGLGFLTFYAYRDKVEKDIEDEKVSEEMAEKKRKEEFHKVHPKMDSIPILRYLLKWMYAVGWKFSIPLVLIIIIFIGIKIGMPLIYAGSYIDEYNHIFSGIEFFKTGHFAELRLDNQYVRGLPVSVIGGLFMVLFGKTIFIAKMVPAIIGIINFFLLYLIAKRVIKRNI